MPHALGDRVGHAISLKALLVPRRRYENSEGHQFLLQHQSATSIAFRHECKLTDVKDILYATRGME
jgi:hypothetical protein